MLPPLKQGHAMWFGQQLQRGNLQLWDILKPWVLISNKSSKVPRALNTYWIGGRWLGFIGLGQSHELARTLTVQQQMFHTRDDRRNLHNNAGMKIQRLKSSLWHEWTPIFLLKRKENRAFIGCLLSDHCTIHIKCFLHWFLASQAEELRYRQLVRYAWHHSTSGLLWGPGLAPRDWKGRLELSSFTQ